MKPTRSLAAFMAVAANCAALTSPPLTDWVTYLGGAYSDSVQGMAIDSSGSEYVAGTTNSPDFPLTSIALGDPSEAASCAFVTKFNPAGNALEFSICVANYQAVAFGIDSAGNIYLAVKRQTPQGSSTYSVLKLDPTGQNILYTAPIPIGVTPEAMAVDESGNVYLTGSAVAGLATAPGAYQQQLSPGTCPSGTNGQGPCPDAFAIKLAPSGAVSWATYLGGSGPDDGHAIAIDSLGSPWIVGATVSSNFPVTSSAADPSFGGEVDLGPQRYGDAFVAKFDPTGGKLLYSTYLGGNAPDAAFAVTVDATNSAWVTGGTSSSNFPTTPGALQTTYIGGSSQEPTLAGNAFVTKFDSSGKVVYSTLVGAYGTMGTAIAVNRDEQAAINVAAASLSGQATACAGQPAVTVLTADGLAVAGFSPVSGSYLSMDGNGSLYSAGTTQALAFLSTPHAFQTSYGGGDSDAFAGKVDFTQPAAPALLSVVSGATFFGGYAWPATGAVAPGEVVALFGNGFGSQPSVTFDELSAPILYASNCQINAVVPFGLTAGVSSTSAPFATASTFVIVLAGSQTIGPLRLPVVAAVPGIFVLNGSGTGQAAVINQNGTVNSSSNPAPRGSIIAVYMTGTGALIPPVADGSFGPLSPPFPMPVQSITAQIGLVNSQVVFTGQAPGLIAGVTQVNVQIPANAPTGASVPITIEAGGYSSGGFSPQESQVFIAVQ